MNQIKIELEGEGVFRPGEVLRGKVSGLHGSGENRHDLRLFWVTRGRGTEDLEVVASQSLGGLGRDVDFQFDLPMAPPSFSGTLISVVWFLELVDADGHAVAECEFIMSPTGQELRLREVDAPKHAAKKNRWNRGRER